MCAFARLDGQDRLATNVRLYQGAKMETVQREMIVFVWKDGLEIFVTHLFVILLATLTTDSVNLQTNANVVLAGLGTHAKRVIVMILTDML